jgi:hypothetical protein
MVTDSTTQLVCSHCHRDIECCAGCDRTDCPNGVCYRCMILELHMSHPHPHEYGGAAGRGA